MVVDWGRPECHAKRHKRTMTCIFSYSVLTPYEVSNKTITIMYVMIYRRKVQGQDDVAQNCKNGIRDSAQSTAHS